MEKVIGQVFKSGDKLFVTEEECARYEKKVAIEDFLTSRGYEFYDGRMRKACGLGVQNNIFLIHDDRIRYSRHVEFQHNCLEFKLCDIELFKMFYDNMFID